MGYKVKQLEWNNSKFNSEGHLIQSSKYYNNIGCWYLINVNKQQWEFCSDVFDADKLISHCKSLKEGREKAQEHFEQMIIKECLVEDSDEN